VRTAALLPLGCLVTALLAGCAGPAPAPAAPPTPTYQLPPRPVRPGETALALAPRQAGDTQFTLIGLSSLDSILGSHAEMNPKGRYIRVRLVIVNTGRSGTAFDTKRQQLVTADGVAHDVDPQAMLIKRQPGDFDLGANVRVEFDLYYDVPRDARPVALRVHGGPTLTDLLDTQSVDLPLG
jgi:Domain of unknown function (DUF4352)